MKCQGVTPRGIAYTVRGTGPPVLWLSGYVVAAETMASVVSGFADRYTCITFDHRGSGRSRPPVGPMTTARMARDALSVLGDLDVDSAHVHGTSLGGMVAQELALQAPHRVRTLVLGGTTAGGVAAESPAPQALLRGLWHAREEIPGPSRIGIRGALHQGWAAATHDSTSRLNRIQVPTLVVHGSRDELVPVSNARTLAELIPGAELRVVRGAGHLFLFQSRTAKEVVARWLDAHRTIGAGGRPTSVAVLRDVTVAPWRLAADQTLPMRRAVRALPGLHSRTVIWDTLR
jgi:3-oxoadipate enol-lactonase